ncbi:hypothetical protein HDU84_006327 [Entophlyctis sp. JEL0112]|nr:hypothetical protein HDU84_006327 [Entophlyctis sp. JEL0112]
MRKLFVEALSRGTEFEVSSNDYKTSHRTVIIPGLVNASCYFPGMINVMTDRNSHTNKFAAISRAAIAGGFSTLCVTSSGQIKYRVTLVPAQANAKAGTPRADYTLNVSGLRDNSAAASAVSSDVAALTIDPGDSSSCSLVTCDVNVHALYLARKEYPNCLELCSPEDVAALWENLDVINCFTAGSLPYAIWKSAATADSNLPAPNASAGLEEVLPLLLTVVAEGKLTIDDVVSRTNTRLREIFNLPEQSETYVEVEVDRKVIVTRDSYSVGWTKVTALFFEAKQSFWMVKLVSLYKVKINLVAADIREISRKNGVKCYETFSLDEVIAITDALYVTRIQKERFEDLAEWSLACTSSTTR